MLTISHIGSVYAVQVKCWVHSWDGVNSYYKSTATITTRPPASPDILAARLIECRAVSRSPRPVTMEYRLSWNQSSSALSCTASRLFFHRQMPMNRPLRYILRSISSDIILPCCHVQARPLKYTVYMSLPGQATILSRWPCIQSGFVSSVWQYI